MTELLLKSELHPGMDVSLTIHILELIGTPQSTGLYPSDDRRQPAEVVLKCQRQAPVHVLRELYRLSNDGTIQ